jgi:hypothetical protein
MADLDALLDERGFGKALDVAGRTSIADLFAATRRTGIYVLSFADGEVYAGKSVDVTRRYHQHRKTHSDLAKLRFLRVPRRVVDETEREVIWALEEVRARMRNIQFMSEPDIESDFDVEVMTDETQRRFLGDVNFNDATGERTQSAELRARYSRRYQEFAALPGAKKTMELLRSYIRTCVPAWVRSELSFWSLSCLPNRTRVLARVNINWQEVLAVFTSKEDKSLWTSFFVAKSPLEKAFGEDLSGFGELFPDSEPDDDLWEPGGQDQLHILAPIETAHRFLEREEFLHAARLFNLRLMRKGPCVYARHHCFDLADQVIALNGVG